MTQPSPTANTPDRATDRGFLQVQYGSVSRLQTRTRTHELYSENREPFQQWVLRQVGFRPGQIVLDAGCGYGSYHPYLTQAAKVYAFDPSESMVEGATVQATEQSLPVEVSLGSVEAIPLPDGSCDLVMCNHVLYHVEDRLAALRELARVLRPGGRIALATNGRWSLREPSPSDRFNLNDHLDLVREVFPKALRRWRRDAFVFPSMEAVNEYLDTLDSPSADLVRRAERAFARRGFFRLPKRSGCFVARGGAHP